VEHRNLYEGRGNLGEDEKVGGMGAGSGGEERGEEGVVGTRQCFKRGGEKT